MKKPILLFAVKCFTILYFVACTSIDDYTVTKSATPVVTNGAWRVTLYMDNNNDQTNAYAGYTFTFEGSGNVKASKNGVDVTGSWAEDNILKQVTINFNTTDPSLAKLNDNWNITQLSNSQVNFESPGKPGIGKLNISNR